MEPSCAGAGTPEELSVLLQLRDNTSSDGSSGGGSPGEGKILEDDGWKNSAGWPPPAAPARSHAAAAKADSDGGAAAARTRGHPDLKQWYGLGEDMIVSLDGPSHVRSIKLSGNNLRGPLPENLDALRHCSTIDLSDNDVTGGVPEALYRMPGLTVLDLGNNPRLRGRLFCPPTDVVGGTERPCMLHVLCLANCGLEGPIPPPLLTLLSSSLAHLDLGGNSLSGGIPASVGGMSNLQSLRLGDNLLAGICPPELLALMDVENPDSQLVSCVLEGNKDLVASSFPNGAVNWTGERKDDY